MGLRFFKPFKALCQKRVQMYPLSVLLPWLFNARPISVQFVRIVTYQRTSQDGRVFLFTSLIFSCGQTRLASFF